MHVEAIVSFEPMLNRWVLMRHVVIDNEVQINFLRGFPVDFSRLLTNGQIPVNHTLSPNNVDFACKLSVTVTAMLVSTPYSRYWPASLTNPWRFEIDAGSGSRINRLRRTILLHFWREGLQTICIHSLTFKQALKQARSVRLNAR
jgi:hypothetical protein